MVEKVHVPSTVLGFHGVKTSRKNNGIINLGDNVPRRDVIHAAFSSYPFYSN